MHQNLVLIFVAVDLSKKYYYIGQRSLWWSWGGSLGKIWITSTLALAEHGSMSARLPSHWVTNFCFHFLSLPQIEEWGHHWQEISKNYFGSETKIPNCIATLNDEKLE